MMTDDEIEALAKKHIAPHADRLANIRKDWPPYQQTEQFRRVKAFVRDVEAKLRAPVADERAAFETAYTGMLNDRSTPPTFAAFMRNPDGSYALPIVERAWAMWQARAALASAPVAGEARQLPTINVGGNERPQQWFTAKEVRQLLDGAPQASEAVRDAGIAASEDVAPWTDFAGNPIKHGDRIRHPEGLEGVVVRLPGYADAHDAWCVAYQDRTVSRLSLQIGHRGQAVVQGALSAQPGAQRTGGSEAVRDAERLEFLITHGAWVAWSKDHELCRVFHRDEDGDVEPFLGWRQSARAAAYTARDAIDAAMGALSAQPGAQRTGGSEAQKPVGKWVQVPHGNYVGIQWAKDYTAAAGDELYLKPYAPPQARKPGYALVPIEPTKEMLSAAVPGYATGNDARRAIYKAMVGAAK